MNRKLEFQMRLIQLKRANRRRRIRKIFVGIGIALAVATFVASMVVLLYG